VEQVFSSPRSGIDRFNHNHPRRHVLKLRRVEEKIITFPRKKGSGLEIGFKGKGGGGVLLEQLGDSQEHWRAKRVWNIEAFEEPIAIPCDMAAASPARVSHRVGDIMNDALERYVAQKSAVRQIT